MLSDWAKRWYMKFHPAKCYVMNISTKTTATENKYTLMDEQLKTVNSMRYLGVTVTNKMKWNSHVDEMVSTANRTLGFLRRNLNQCPPKVKAHAYTALVRPTLEYASAVWDPHSTKNTKKLDQVQRRAVSFKTGETKNEKGCVTKALIKAGWPTLETCRRATRLTHKCTKSSTATTRHSASLTTFWQKQTNT